MKTLLFKILIFGLISSVILNVVFDPIFKDLIENGKTFSDFNEDKNPLDILILGSSHAKNSYNPEMIDAVFNTNTYNLGTYGQLLLVSNYLLDDVLKTKKPKLVIVDLNPNVMNLPGLAKSKGYQLRVFDYTGFSLQKVNSIHRIYDFKEMPSVFYETIRNHDEWFNRNWTLEEFEADSDTKFVKGFLNSARTMNSKDKNTYKDYINQYNQFLKTKPNPQEYLDFETTNKDLINTINYCKENGIKLLFVSAPYFSSFYQKRLNKFHYLMNEYLEKNNIHCIDFNENFNSLGLELDDFSNHGHLNLQGSTKVSAALIDAIAEKEFFKISDSSSYINLLKKINPRKEFIQNENITLERLINKSITTGVTFNVSHKLTNNIKVDKIIFNNTNESRYIILENKFVSDDSIINDYYFLLSGTVYKSDFDKRPKWNLGTEKDKIFWEASPKRIIIDNKNYFILELDRKCSINQFKTFKIALKRKANKKSLGAQIILNDIKLKN